MTKSNRGLFSSQGDITMINNQIWPVFELCSQQQLAVNFQPQHVKTAWKKFKKLLPVLSSRHLPFKTRGSVYSSCVRSAMLHASETWPLTKPNLQCLQQNDRAMIRQICNVRPQDIVTTRSRSGFSMPMSYLCGLALRIWTSF